MSKNVLLVDDDASVRSIVCRMLEHLGCRVLIAAHAEEALSLFNDEIDVLVTDMVMPRMNGRILAETLRRSRPDLHVVFSSGHGEGEDLAVGADVPYRYLQKPFTAAELEQALLG